MIMKVKILVFGLGVMAYLFIASPVNASVELDHLNKAKAAIVAKHYHQGYARFKKLANHGCPFSQCILGIMHQKGMGVEKNASQALYWFQKSAQQGFADAERRLGLMYYHGDGVPKNLKLAKLWLSRAAQHGVIEAEQLAAKIPPVLGGNNIADSPNLAANATWTVNNIRRAWGGYGEVTRQLDQLSSAGTSQ
jgi:TPR repeat protein